LKGKPARWKPKKKKQTKVNRRKDRTRAERHAEFAAGKASKEDFKTKVSEEGAVRVVGIQRKGRKGR